ncbi:Lovastatin nonaketide synthase [Colletotrichum sp. SAR 10_76]|nr:Lovastatin nonaketide synthase [Colletotrichum sp. SAR 10_76]
MVPRDVESQPSSTTYGMPIVLSAKSQRSLRDNMSAMLRFLESDPGIDMADLAWTLMHKQAALPVRHAIPSHTREGACLALQAAIKENLGIESSSNRGNKGPPQILGIFTGQGVQWPGMCKSLLASIPWTREIIDELDASLQTLPTAYRPTWTLRQRLCCDDVESQPTEARFSQPLCAAVQLVLLRLLEAAGIKFTTIVGHSSGEIVCAAAAGYITPFQAIRIAYLRGLAVTTSDAEPPDGARGAMLAAEITHEDAEELCSLEDFEGRICVAAYNAPTSVTISGDADALQHVEAILKDEGKFTRFLPVDKAYHSHHMAQFSDAYTKSLVECGCAANPASKTPDSSSPVAWYSSVYDGRLLKYSTFQWQSFIKPQDDKWLEGHDLQGQPILPAAGYVAMAMEAALHVTRKRVAQDVKVTVLEVLDLSIDKAISFDDKNSMAELLVTLKVTHQSAEQLEAEVHIDSALDRETNPSNSASGRVVATFGSPSMCLPRRGLNEPLHPNDIDISSFYRELELLGLDYTKKYRGVHELRRADGRAAGRLSQYRLGNSSEQDILLHPATLDTAFQAIMGAFSYPGDKALRSTVVPVHIDRIALVPGACASALGSHDEVSMRFNATCSSFKDSILSGDVEVFDENSSILFQVDNIVLQPLYKSDPSSDHLMFTKTVWGPYSPDRILDRPEFWATAEDKRMIPIIERIVYHYVKDFLSTLTQEDRRNASAGLQKYIHWNEQVLEKAREWKTTFYEPNWEMDTSADVHKLCEENWYHPYVRLVKRVSENAISTIRDNTNPFHWMNADGLLSEFYASPLSNGPCWNYGQDLVGQICHRFPNMNILEIGAGTGSATRYVFNIPQLGLNSYTFTDISATFFDKAREVFSQHKDCMDFRKLDITRDPVEQGFTPHSYDLVIASSVLHATPRLVDTMTNVRSLLKPGGHVVIAEATFKEYLRTSYIFGLFPDWWAGYEEGRVLDPFASYEEWDSILKRSGFSGIDSRTSNRESWVFQNSLFSAHAINPKVQRLDSPLLKVPNGQNHGADMPQLIFVGGLSDRSSALLSKLEDKLTHRRILRLDSLETMAKQAAQLEIGSTFVVVSELDDEMFGNLNDVKLEAAKSLLSGDYAKVVVWITEAAFTHNPRQAMTIGLLRTIQLENPQINILNIDVDNAEHLDYPALIAEHVAQLEETAKPPEDSSGLLWSHEPEMYLVDGRTWIPRIKHDAARNSRLNSARRVILSDARSNDTPVRLRLSADGASSYLEFMDTMVNPQTPLDFFIMFSSGATVGGNPGQSNYNAANAYLQALAQYRRAKGLVASTIHVGAVMGIGYLARTHFDEQLLKVHDMGKLAEKDFHTLFAEAIVSGRCALGQEESNTNRMSVTDMSDIEVITGFPVFEAKNKNSFKLWDNPRFGHLRTPENSLSHVGEGSSASRVSIKERLREAKTVDEAKEAIIHGLAQKTRDILLIPADQIVNLSAALLDQGIDSLGAVAVSGCVIWHGGGENKSSSTTLNRHPLSLGQKYVWKLQQLLSHDPTIFHNTIAYFFEGYIDLQRLSTAVDEVVRRHEILRTAFLANPEPDTGNDAIQVVLEKPTWGLKCTSVANQAAAREAMKQLHEEPYGLEFGRPFKIVDFHWSSARRHLLVIAYHRLAGDGATTSILLSEVSALYDGAVLPATVPQFSKITMRQRADYEQGRLDADIAYWISQYNNNNAVPVMPVLGLPHCRFLERSNGPPSSWSQHTGVFRLSSAVSAQVKQAVREQRVSRMQFFMAVYAALLVKLTTKASSREAVATKDDCNDDDARTITIGIADTNRATMEDMAAMGFFANYLPVRIETREKEDMSPLSPSQQLGVIKKAMRGAMQHARVPYSVLLERLPVVPSLQTPAKDWPHAPLFQAVFDYAGGGVESVRIGDAVITEQGGLQASELVARERTPYDVVLEIWDDAARDPLVIVKLQSSLYDSEDVTVFYNAFVELLATYSADLMSLGA